MSEPTIVHGDDLVTLWSGDALDVLHGMPDACVTAVVTDPPYGLANLSTKKVVDALTRWLGGDRGFVPDGGGGFMSARWDRFVPPPALWDEVFRVLKPGGFLLCFAAPRTQDLMGISIRLSGFEVRDSILQWVTGSGMPKGRDVSKLIDKEAGSVRDVVGTDPLRARRLRAQAGGYVTEAGWKMGGRTAEVTAPASEVSAAWAGWAAALKPAHEPILVARKPLDGTLAHNTVMHGTGALHVDAVRVPFTSARDELDTAGESAPGRWPSNVLFCHHPLCEPTGGTMVVRGDRRAGVGYQPGLRPGGFLNPGTVGKGDTRPSSVRPDETVEVWDCHPNCPVGELDRQSVDARGRGTATRYFPTFCYSPKATVTERPVVDGVQHVTVKPLSVIRWLVDLVATPGGTLLDPFAGSGTLAEACIDAGVRCIVIENHEPYVPLILERIRRARGVAA